MPYISPAFCPGFNLSQGYRYLRGMSKRALKKYVSEVPKKELQKQVLDLYERFPVVKKYYDFVFNPKEEAMIREAKSRIGNEYFPLRRNKPRARRSVAQRYIKQFRKLEMDPAWIAELMVFNLETALAYEEGHRASEAFYRSMLNSFTEVLHYVTLNRLMPDFRDRIKSIYQKVQQRNWLNAESFSSALEALD